MPTIERMESRQLLSAAIAPLGLAANVITDATDLGAFKIGTARSKASAVGIGSTDVAYKVELTKDMNLSVTVEKLLQTDQVYLLYADGTMVNPAYQNKKATVTFSQHLTAGTYYVDIEHGYVAANTTDVGAAATKPKVTPVKKYKIKPTDNFLLVLRGLKPDKTVAPVEPAKTTSFSAAFGASAAASEPTVSATLAQSSGYVGYKAFSTADGYVLWGANGPQPEDEVQQYIGDCYFMSIISSIARDDPGLIEQDIVPQSDGDFLVKFQNNGQEVDEQVDDMFPVNAEGQTVFAQIPADNVLWPAILEKAWCYFRPDSTSPDSYDGIQSGEPSESLLAFGSPNAVDIPASNYNTASSLLTAISTQLTAGDLVDVGTENANSDPLPSGLFTGHAYSVVKVDVASNSIELRNPWGTNTEGVQDDGTQGYITITGDQLIQSIADFSYGSLTAVTPNNNTTVVTPTPTPTPTPTTVTTTTTTQTIPGNLGPNAFVDNGGNNYDFYTFTATTNGQAEITVNSTAFTPQLLIAQDGTDGWRTVGSDTNSTNGATADVTFTAQTGVTYGIGVFVSSTNDTGAYTLTLTGALSAPVQETPSTGTGSLTGTVFNDSNNNGVQDNGETGLANVTVYLDLAGTGTFTTGDPTATTDSVGTYTFTGLAPGNYTVYVESPSGDIQTTPASNAGAAVTVTAGEVATVAAFGEFSQGGGSISGTVYLDAKGDGHLDSGDTGLVGWYVYADLGDTGQYVTGDPYTQTDANGNFSFTNVPAGSYTLRVYPMSGYTTTQGASGLVVAATSSGSVTGVDFGEAQPSGTITGLVYQDNNDDGVADSGDVGLAGWQVYIDVNDTGSYVSGDPVATTDSSGAYTFTGLPAGNYIIRVVPQSGYTTDQGSLGWTATVVPGQTVNGGPFGETQATGSLSGTVYFDSNHDGALDGSEGGIYNWAVYIDLNDSGSYQTGDPYVITGSSGAYSFTGLAPGTYIIRAAIYTDLPYIAGEGSDGYSVTVVGNENTFGGNFGEYY